MSNNTTQSRTEPISIMKVLKLFLSGIALTVGVIAIILLYYPPQPVYDTTDDFFNISIPVNDKFKDVPLPSAKGQAWYDPINDHINDSINDTTNETVNKSVYDTENASWLYQTGYYGRSSGRSSCGQYPLIPVPELKTLCGVLIGLFGIGLITFKKVM